VSCRSEHPCKQSDLRGTTLFLLRFFLKKMKRETTPQFK